MDKESDQRWMYLALALGSRGLGKTWPNPSVGCVIISNDKVVGRGFTAAGGRPHAEILALEQAGKLAENSTVYVTLEPCAHHGKTGPCVEALVKAKVRRVVVSLKDPDVRVCGIGIEALKQAGILVSLGMLRKEALEVNRGFINKVLLERPLVTLKISSTFDGKIATDSGESQWITGPESRRKVHTMRAKHDAILVGGGTARKDLPLLTVRGLGVKHSPIRILVSNNLNLPQQSPMADSCNDSPIWLIHGPNPDTMSREFWLRRNAKLIEVPLLNGNHLDLTVALRALAQMGITRIFCEGGGKIAASLIQNNLVDRVIGFTGGKIFGALGVPGMGALSSRHLKDMPTLTPIEIEKVGNDILHTWTVVQENTIMDRL
jgi:diaminohydroxyphosphoribosylaminopyrimidine deaminase/5-amino-6-(5-phosphoribosylamino)uracil reductase